MRIAELEVMIEVEILYLDANHRAVAVERTIADRIMPMGARILIQKEANIGSSLQVRTTDGKFQAMAVIKEVQQGKDHIWRMVVEFLGSDWKRNWLFPRDPREQLNEDLLDCSKQTYALLLSVQTILQEGGTPGLDSLTRVKDKIDELRKVIFSAQRMGMEN